MKSVTIAVILSGLVSYGTTYSPPAVPTHGQSFSALAIDIPPLSSDPDDDEDDRVKPPSTRRKSK